METLPVASLGDRPTVSVPPGDDDVRGFLAQHNADVVARRGHLLDATARPALVVRSPDGDIAGVLTYDIAGAECEILTLHAATRWGGAGTALVDAVRGVAARAGCHTLWVLTTNDNVDALRFYQRRGFRMSALRPGAVDESRQTLKPQIPLTGSYGIPLHDEIELAITLPARERAEAPAEAAPASTPRTN
jgi:GNAT superfamily N-acetyltransferase